MLCVYIYSSLAIYQITVFGVLLLLCLGMVFFDAGSGIIISLSNYPPEMLMFAGAIIVILPLVSVCSNVYNLDTKKYNASK